MMPDAIKRERRWSPGAAIALVTPLFALLAGYALVYHLEPGIDAHYDQYREFRGGNPSEVFSHWLDMMLMSGGAVMIAWMTGVESFFLRSGNTRMCRAGNRCAMLFLVLSGAIAHVLDGMHGEGAIMLAYPMFFIPLLVSSWYLLRQIAALARWRPGAVMSMAPGFVVFHVAAQLYYEPSNTGAPNLGIIPVWLASVGGALVWAFVKSIRTGLLARLAAQLVEVGRRPVVWSTTILIALAIGIPVTLDAQRLHRPRQDMAFAWLDDLEARLTNDFVATLKRHQLPAEGDANSKMPISASAHALLADARIKDENALRIYIPLEDGNYIFLWANNRFEYCDLRRLNGGEAKEMDQDFIDDLIAHGGTLQTGLYSILWSPYMAGRVLKGTDGKVKAICVINAP